MAQHNTDSKDRSDEGARVVDLAAFTDMYQLTMMQSYFNTGMDGDATFDLFVRRMPPNRNYLIACGLDEALDYLEDLSFHSSTVAYLDSLNQFSDEFLAYLESFRFTGEVYAMEEGTPCFASEPMLQLTAPIPQAQVVETYLLNQVQFMTMMASKAARVAHAAGGRTVVDFGARRMHGSDASLKAARAFYVAGVASTSNVLAGKIYGIPVAGTMAHSFIEAHADEMQAFERFTDTWPATTLLVDTYDTLEGIRNVVRLARKLGDDFQVRAIRLDSGDLGELAIKSRRVLDEAGLTEVQIFASSSLDEYMIQELLTSGAPIDGFGVGTKMGVSEDAPSLDGVYKLAAYAGEGRMKLSPEKETLPHLKQIYRQYDRDSAVRDVICLRGEDMNGEALLRQVMKDGRRTSPRESLDEQRQRCQRLKQTLPERLLDIKTSAISYDVSLSEQMKREKERVRDGILDRIGADAR